MDGPPPLALFTRLNSDDSFGRVNRPCTRNYTRSWQLKQVFCSLIRRTNWSTGLGWRSAHAAPSDRFPLPAPTDHAGSPASNRGGSTFSQAHIRYVLRNKLEKNHLENMKRGSIGTWSLSSGGEGEVLHGKDAGAGLCRPGSALLPERDGALGSASFQLATLR